MSTLDTTRAASLDLHRVTPDDADYILGLRKNPRYNAHLSPVTGTVADQRAWIAAYKAREAAGHEVYYVMRRRDDGRRCGLVRLYDIAGDSFTWGSWILDDAKPRKAALESAVRIYEIGFDELGCTRSVFDVRRANARTLAFHRRFGAREIGADGLNIYFDYSRDRFKADRARFLAALDRQEHGD